jgi:hypothetical protein
MTPLLTGAIAPALCVPRAARPRLAKAPRPAPPPPTARASRPPGRALACRYASGAGPDGAVVCDRAGKRAAFRGPPATEAAFPTDRNDFPVRQAAGMPFSAPFRVC